MPKRNPRNQPIVGDVLHKKSPKGKKLSREVIKVEIVSTSFRWEHDTYFVIYEDQNGKKKRIWCATWSSWTADAMVTTRGAAI